VLVTTVVMSPIVGTAIGHGVQHLLAGRFPRFSKGYGKAFDSDPEKVRQHAEKHGDEPDQTETMYWVFRKVLDAVDPEVAIVLGYMAGQYNYAGKRADVFFRALGRLLCDLEPGELESLRELLRGVESAQAKVPGAFADMAVGVDYTVTIYNEGTDRIELGTFVPGLRLFWLLKREVFAVGSPQNVHWGKSEISPGDRQMRLWFDSAARVLRTIDVYPSKVAV
jgi:hypothetical protein